MRATITITIPDGWLAQRTAEVNADHPGTPALEPAEFLRDRLAGVADDELRIALWGWPLESTAVEVLAE